MYKLWVWSQVWWAHSSVSWQPLNLSQPTVWAEGCPPGKRQNINGTHRNQANKWQMWVPPTDGSCRRERCHVLWSWGAVASGLANSRPWRFSIFPAQTLFSVIWLLNEHDKVAAFSIRSWSKLKQQWYLNYNTASLLSLQPHPAFPHLSSTAHTPPPSSVMFFLGQWFSGPGWFCFNITNKHHNERTNDTEESSPSLMIVIRHIWRQRFRNLGSHHQWTFD